MRGFVLRACVFLALLWIGSFVASSVLDHVFQRGRVQKEFWSLSRHGLAVDYVIAGSSRAFHNVDIRTFEERKGLTAINLGFDGQSTMDMYLTLHLFLAHQNRVKHLLLQIDGWDLSGTHNFLSYFYLPYEGDEEVSTTLKRFTRPEHRVMGMMFPLTRYSEYNTFYVPAFLREVKAGRSAYDETGGSELLFDSGYHEFPAVEQEPVFAADARPRRYLDRIMEMAKAEGIDVTIFSAPVYHGDPIFKKYDQDARRYIDSYCQEHGAAYADFTDAEFDRLEFRDYSHLNGRGALRFTRMLADSLPTGA